MFDLANFLSAVMGSGVIAVVVFALLRDRLGQIPRIKEDLTKLRDERVAKLELSLEKMQDNGCSLGREVKTDVKTVIAQNNEIFGQLRQLNRESAEQKAIQERNSGSLSRLHARLDDHTEKHHG